MIGRLRPVEAIGDRLGKEENLVQGGATMAKAGLKVGEKVVLLREEESPFENHLLEEPSQARSNRNRAVRSARGSWFPSFKNRKNARELPGGRKRVRRPEMIEKEQKEIKSRRREVEKVGVGDTTRINRNRVRERKNSGLKLRVGERRAETSRMGTLGGTNVSDEFTIARAVRLRDGKGEVGSIELGQLLSLPLGGGSTIDGGIRRRGGGEARHRAKNTKGRRGLRRRERGSKLLPSFRLSSRDDSPSTGRGRLIFLDPSRGARPLH